MEFGNKFNSEIMLTFQQTFRQQLKNLRLKVSCCSLCGNACLHHPLLCQYCQADLPYFNYQHLPYDLLSWPAITELIPIKHFDHLLAIAPYVWPFDTWISQLKYQHKTEMAELLSYLLINHWQQYLRVDKVNLTPENTLIIAVPLHLNKWQERGFNQAHLIARKFAQGFDYVYQAELITREKLTESQVGKSGVERRKNLKNAFSLNLCAKVKLPANVILIDDVVTTGTTANEICKLLKDSGVQNITLLCICLAIPS
ncbi:ComF family protein [Colwellia sp. BRX10-3]|uniref:ComF family protein n=1 Tax=Colwellia sp. BRX10-3 TaxID=2759844 RepID=UPI0015F5789B|nr:ComF family protein [Colwellia sp. BRX10-3]MBA6391607.1 ComF family protein [Colwellia sp. BRX10-3]